MDSLIKIEKDAMEPLSDVIIALMDKLENAVGWIATPKFKWADREEAIRCFIQQIEQKEDMAPLEKAALISQSRKILKEYCNITNVLQLAVQQLSESAKPQEIDDDWLFYFYEHAKNINLHEVQILWAKILASECNRNNSIPKILMHILSVMSSRDAKAFESLCSFIIQDVNSKESAINLLFLCNLEADVVKNNGLNYEVLRDLESLGLICQDEDLSCINEDHSNILKLRYHDKNVIIRAHNDKEENFPFGNVTLTYAGLTLSTLIVGKKLEGFLDYFKLFYKDFNYTIEIS